MTVVVIDASVWIAAVDPLDEAHAESQNCLHRLAHGAIDVLQPMHARVEVACALARRFGDPDQTGRLVDALMSAPFLRELAIDRTLAHEAIAVGTSQRLRAADALYAALAARESATLITLDREMRARAGGITPAEWLASLSQA